MKRAFIELNLKKCLISVMALIMLSLTLGSLMTVEHMTLAELSYTPFDCFLGEYRFIVNDDEIRLNEVQHCESLDSLEVDNAEGYTLECDLEITGDVLIKKGTLDLNGYTLTCQNMSIEGGCLRVNKGTLNAEGDFL